MPTASAKAESWQDEITHAPAFQAPHPSNLEGVGSLRSLGIINSPLFSILNLTVVVKRTPKSAKAKAPPGHQIKSPAEVCLRGFVVC